MSAVAIIPARGGSVRIPRKNIRLFHGKPIIAYGIESAKESGLFDEIVVSTDDDEIASVARSYGLREQDIVPRSAAMCGDDIGTQEVAKHALEWLHKRGRVFDYACCIYATTPMLFAADLQAAIRYVYDKERDYVYAKGTFYYGASKIFLDRPDDFTKSKTMNEGRFIDIDTEEDWRKAEQMYASLHKV